MSKEIKDWTNEEVEKVFEYHLDDIHPLDRISVSKTITTVEDKRQYLIEAEENFKKLFK